MSDVVDKMGANEKRSNEKYAIEMQGVHKSFRRTQVLSGLSLRVERGKSGNRSGGNEAMISSNTASRARALKL